MAPAWVQAGVSLDEVPLAAHRRAAQFLQDHIGSSLTPAWQEASLRNEVTPLYRPDVSGVAYYQFSVFPSGYIAVSTGSHDFPIAGWSDAAAAPSAILQERADGKAARFYKLDSLSLVAEDQEGNLLTASQDLPPRLELLNPGQWQRWLGGDSKLNEYGAGATEQSNNDQAESRPQRDASSAVPDQPEIKLGEWKSWRQLKQEYAQTFAFHLAAWQNLTASDWAVENNAAAHGIGLVKGESEKVALLHGDAKVELAGDGAQHVEYQVYSNGQAGGHVRLMVTGSPGARAMADFTVNITYGNGITESLPYFVTEGDPFPKSSGGQRPAWSSGNESHAGTWDDQRLYDQWSCCGCMIGCGPVAWGILFGWADHQAFLGNPYWVDRWGLYRENGGVRPANDADAPRERDAGVTSMILEIRGYVSTLCLWGQGATSPWDMGGASAYFTGRTGARLSTHYNSGGFCQSELRELTRDQILHYATPVVIGMGWMSHYPVAYAYRSRSRRVRACSECWWETSEFQREFQINTGMGPNYGPQWEPAETWFYGTIFPD